MFLNWLRMICLILCTCGPWTAGNVRGLDTITDLKIVDGVATVQFANNPGIYYLLEYSEDLTRWQPVDATLGIRSVLDLEEAARRGFFRAQPNSVFAPLDMDGDGIDDVYELNHPDILDPLDPTDGSKPAPGGDGKTNYQIYLSLFGIKSYKILQRESREWSLFNFGSGDPFESISREHSLFNFGSPSASLEANGREVSLYNGQTVPVSDLLQIEGREVSLFNFGGAAPGQPGGPAAVAEAISHEVSLYNGQTVPVSDLLQRETREWSVFNFGSPTASVEAISREVSVLNFTEP
jgi:hypothetical protein